MMLGELPVAATRRYRRKGGVRRWCTTFVHTSARLASPRALGLAKICLYASLHRVGRAIVCSEPEPELSRCRLVAASTTRLALLFSSGRLYMCLLCLSHGKPERPLLLY